MLKPVSITYKIFDCKLYLTRTDNPDIIGIGLVDGTEDIRYSVAYDGKRDVSSDNDVGVFVLSGRILSKAFGERFLVLTELELENWAVKLPKAITDFFCSEPTPKHFIPGLFSKKGV